MGGHRAGDIGSLRRRGSSLRKQYNGTSAEQLSDLIGSIYDCVLAPANWQGVLERLMQEFGFANSVLAVVPLYEPGQKLNVAVGFDEAWLALAETHRANGVAIWGGPERMQRFPLEEPIVASQLASYSKRLTNPYFIDVLEPRGIFDAVLMTIAREASMLGYLALNRHVSAGDIDENEVHMLRLLGPHFRRAVTISNLFDMKAIEIGTFAATLDTLTVGVILVDDNLCILHRNESAARMLGVRGPIQAERGAIAVRSSEAQTALESAVRQAASNEAALGQRGIGIPLQLEHGEPCVIHVLPLKRTELRRGLVQRAAAALFVTPGGPPPRMPLDAFALLYDLTPAESRIVDLVCDGKTQEEISDFLGIARATVKTHLLHVFEKTSCSRQVDLVRLAAKLSLPV